VGCQYALRQQLLRAPGSRLSGICRRRSGRGRPGDRPL